MGDMPLLYFLLTKNVIDMNLKVPSGHVQFPYICAGDSLRKFSERFPSYWTRKLLTFWRLRTTKFGGEGQTEERRSSRLLHSKVEETKL
jgi:hypothetical protein